MSRNSKPFGTAEAVNTHVAGGREYSPLSSLLRCALRRYGDVNAGAAYPETQAMLLEMANEVVEEVNMHPYTKVITPYYVHTEDVRPIADAIVIAGVLYLYAEQQNSQKAGTYRAKFYLTMNRILSRLTIGNGPIEVRPVDGGSRLENE